MVFNAERLCVIDDDELPSHFYAPPEPDEDMDRAVAESIDHAFKVEALAAAADEELGQAVAHSLEDQRILESGAVTRQPGAPCTSSECDIGLERAAVFQPGGGTVETSPRTTGLRGGARGDRNHDLMLVGARVRKLVRSHVPGPRFVVTEYLVIGVDMVQQHAYDVEDLQGARLKTDLLRRLMRTPDEPLERQGEWQLLPHQASIVPLHPTAFFCARCMLQSSHKPCVQCHGSDGTPDHVLLNSQQFSSMAEAQSLDTAQPQSATSSNAAETTNVVDQHRLSGHEGREERTTRM